MALNNSETEKSKEISQKKNDKIISPLPYMDISVCTRCVFKSYLQATRIHDNRTVEYLPNQWIAIFARFDWLP